MRAGVCGFCIALQLTFSVRTDMVVLPVTVTDARGHSVAGLSSSDFTILDEGRAQEIAIFHGGEVPVTIGLLLDHSQSMGPKIGSVNAAVAEFARSGRPDDELFVIGFNDHVHVLPFAGGKLFTNDPVELMAALTSDQPSGATAFFDAVDEGLRHLDTARGSRKALIVVSDGGDNASHVNYVQVRNAARRSDAVIYGVGLLGADFEDEAPEVLKQLCLDSGGLAYFPSAKPDPKNDVASAFRRISEDLREQYTLGFVPQGNSTHTFHPVSVTVRGPGGAKLHARTRTGYDSSPVK